MFYWIHNHVFIESTTIFFPLLQRRNARFAIRWQRLFHNVDFFVFFINIFVGLYSFLVRFLLNFVLGLLWISRLDKNMMSRGYESVIG